MSLLLEGELSNVLCAYYKFNHSRSMEFFFHFVDCSAAQMLFVKVGWPSKKGLVLAFKSYFTVSSSRAAPLQDGTLF